MNEASELTVLRKEPTQQRSRERVERMLAAARDLIAEQGSDAMKMGRWPSAPACRSARSISSFRTRARLSGRWRSVTMPRARPVSTPLFSVFARRRSFCLPSPISLMPITASGWRNRPCATSGQAPRPTRHCARSSSPTAAPARNAGPRLAAPAPGCRSWNVVIDGVSHLAAWRSHDAARHLGRPPGR
jgi:hypothetical protein